MLFFSLGGYFSKLIIPFIELGGDCPPYAHASCLSLPTTDGERGAWAGRWAAYAGGRTLSLCVTMVDACPQDSLQGSWLAARWPTNIG
jgi:hypothetical protein